MLRTALTFVAFLALCGSAYAQLPDQPVQQATKGTDEQHRKILGEWLTEEGKARVRIEQCGDRYCGTIVWLREPEKDGKPVVDDKNPDRSLRGRPVLGLEIVRDFEYDEDGVWSGGIVYDPESGNDYKGKITLEDERTLELRGYILIPLFGRSETWTRVVETP